ncbi:succinate dehydrogenase cytochrome b subunit [Phycicoccus sp. CSK15P-2]|uniref:succinate dehydrogenase cytochrome b subunit n=1 Tax=Phycicoccus sp. CSK15P-2 TaxID=2807627 RepID=UPI0019507D95|nr:succinate dehydrogenase cytochrome b subunit [Phycicoccus sp. CSK15P-2]MBM6402670.1 succinate dehydrogenase cytochrome b subunit [Phycicoccus sp. CSK15P-2]
MATTTSSRPAAARRTTIGLKILMAGTGLVFVGYVLLHMYGNLKLLAGEEAFNTYAEHLRTIGEPMLPHGGLLWAIRVVLVLSLVGHAYAAYSLWSRAGSARRTKYAAVKTASRTAWMRWGGTFILLFVVWHLLQFTILKFSVNGDKQGADVTQNPYELVVASFQVPWNTLIYVLALVALAFHLSHGTFSAQQTLGLTGDAGAYRRAKVVGHALAAVVVVGFLIPPLSILFGLIT